MKISNAIRHMAVVLLLQALPSTAGAQQEREYTAEHPLIIISDWDFPPYEFRNDNGEPDGFNIEVMGTIFRQLNIPFKFEMKEWPQATEQFEKYEADIILDTHYKYHGRPYMMARNVLNFFQVKVATREGTAPLLPIDSLTERDTIVLKHNSYSDIRIHAEHNLKAHVEYHSATDALAGLAGGKYKYFIFEEEPLRWKIKELHLDSLLLNDSEIPSGEIHIIGYNKRLIDDIDDQYARLEQTGELERIHDKWFHPDRVHNDTSPMALIVLLGIVVVAVIALLMSRLIRLRVKAAMRRSVDLNNMMKQALSMGDYYVTEYDIETNRMKNVYGYLLPDDGMTLDEFISRIHQDEQAGFRRELERLKNGESQQWDLRKRFNAGTPEVPLWRYLHGNAIAEAENGKTRYIVNSVKDVTSEVEDERVNRELSSKYMNIFETNLIAMSFYSKDGMLIDLNQKMRALCEFTDENEQFFRTTSMFDIPLFRDDFDPKSPDAHHVCQHMSYPELGINKYIEFRIRPSYTEHSTLAYYVVTARDITDERIMYLEQRRHDRELQKTNESISLYAQQLRYLLENSESFVIEARLDERTISYRRSQELLYTQSFDEYLETVTEEDREEARRVLLWNRNEPFTAVLHFHHTKLNDQPSCFTFSCMPTVDAEGRVTGHFGVAQNISQLVEIQQKLKEETARAENSGRLKAAFLANMTHEIRTPLNAIVGFSDILQMVDTEEERMEFIRIIRNNCDMLLRLINDILEASSMGQALAIEPVDCDFSQVFDDICQTLAQRVQEPGVEFIKDNPYPTFPAHLDKGRIQQVLTNFTTNAVKYTHEGHIKVGYRSQDGGVYFYCEDTGAGIPKEKQASVFERFVKLNDFVQGTGLGLSICKSIAERCGGKIGLTSEGEGHGSTFWMWIPQ